MKRQCSWMIAIPFAFLTACGPTKNATTDCIYNQPQIDDLEIAAAGGDMAAMRELDLCYQFNQKDADRRRVHQMRLNANDPEALQEEAMLLARQADRSKDVGERRDLLKRALQMAETAAKKQGLTETGQDMTVRYITEKMAPVR